MESTRVGGRCVRVHVVRLHAAGPSCGRPCGAYCWPRDSRVAVLINDDVYTVKKVNGKSITLNNDEVYKRTSLLIVPKSTTSDEKNVIVKTNKQNKEERFLKK